MSRSLAGALAAVVALSGGCSLMGLGDFELPRCTSDADCAAVNAAQGIDVATACELFQCVEQTGACARRPRDADEDGEVAEMCGGPDCDDDAAQTNAGGTESCDGADNDCDRIIDEGVVQTVAGEVVADVGGAERFAYSTAGEAAARALWTDSARTGHIVTLTGELPHAPSELGYQWQTNESSLAAPPTMESACPIDSGGVRGAVCDVSDGALAPAIGSTFFVATVNKSGCVQGELRIGYLSEPGETSAGNDVVLRGPHVRSNIYLGVDLVGRCTGARRCAAAGGCTGDPSDPVGAARPAIATVGAPSPMRAQALAVWLGATEARGACGGIAVDVEALAVFQEKGTSGGEDIAWVTASNSGTPQPVGRTMGGGSPGVAAWADHGVFVAFGDASAANAVALYFVPSATPPAPIPLGALPGDDRPTDPLTLGPAFTTLDPASGPADHVALAVGAERSGTVDIGVAWVKGCGAADAAILFARVVYDSADPARSRAGEPVQLGQGAVAAPSIVYVDDPGFVTPGFSRGGSAPADESTDGGWLVAWEDHSGGRSRAVARRVLELDGQAIDADAPIDLTLARSGMDPRFTALFPPSDMTRPTIGFAYFDGGASPRALVGGRLACAPPAAPAP